MGGLTNLLDVEPKIRIYGNKWPLINKESSQIERFFENYFSVDGKVVPEKDPDSSEVH